MFAPTDTTAKETASASAFAAQERLSFQARLEKFNNQVQTVRQAITLYEKEIQSLQAQIASEQKQAKAIEREIEELRALVGRGLAPAPRVLPLERTLAQAEREQRELETLVIRARQQIDVSEQTIVTLRDERRGNAVAELQTVQAQVKEVSQKYNTAQRMLAGAGFSSPEFGVPAEAALPSLLYSIVRAEGEEMQERSVTDDPLGAGRHRQGEAEAGRLVSRAEPTRFDRSVVRWRVIGCSGRAAVPCHSMSSP